MGVNPNVTFLSNQGMQRESRTAQLLSAIYKPIEYCRR
jgi:hypothetical protein